ncbi:MAG: ATPase, T2SS/T4P/T4SS family [Candidatus Calescibacterium sp.]|nr:ATPase, T2SS/T4P/T4SS family [Candidatus Calescibacterium sp.]MCX7971625.1 ATPase, T2SS/T4P/T4SS family [bacterium]MDW8195833.1 ATPase, T2SS/T4P/T4SS family [Candidatus Calescibacterium sp.]
MGILEKLFEGLTTSVHIKADKYLLKKVGTPGNWSLIKENTNFSQEETNQLIQEILNSPKAVVEIERPYTKVVQLDRYRIVIVQPPVSDSTEITIVKPIKRLSLEDYWKEFKEHGEEFLEKLKDRIDAKVEGLLIAGAPGQGKTTFAQALTEYFANNKKIVKTLESPRDLYVEADIAQYSKNYANISEIYDILLLSRPDYVIFDEMRNDEDFNLYIDLRLAGVGMVGVVHSTSPFAAIQRFVHRIELGIIPSVIDTVIFVDKGKISKVLALNILVKVPEGMVDPGLARPVVEVRNFLDNTLEYEIYTFGEQTIIVPIAQNIQKNNEKIIKKLEENIKAFLGNKKFKIDLINPRYAIIWVNEKHKKDIIGKKGRIIKELEQILNMKLDVKTFVN